MNALIHLISHNHKQTQNKKKIVKMRKINFFFLWKIFFSYPKKRKTLFLYLNFNIAMIYRWINKNYLSRCFFELLKIEIQSIHQFHAFNSHRLNCVDFRTFVRVFFSFEFVAKIASIHHRTTTHIPSAVGIFGLCLDHRKSYCQYRLVRNRVYMYAFVFIWLKRFVSRLQRYRFGE